MRTAIDKLSHLLEIIPSKLKNIPQEEMSLKPKPDKWSKKEILGHLIDSATANHHRFVRGQFEDLPEISYDQDRWNECNYYQNINQEQIISFWEQYNRHILEVVSRIPAEKLANKVKAGDYIETIEFFIGDYVDHQEYHLKQIVEY